MFEWFVRWWPQQEIHSRTRQIVGAYGASRRKKNRAVVLASGLWDFEDAVRLRDAMAQTLNEAYTFVDLLCFMCLKKVSGEATE